jgi:hypothetical protein
MITGVNFRPKFYSPAYNPVIWSVTSDHAGNTTYIDFKYVFDIYVDSVKVNRIKQRPNPANAGMLDVSLIVQSYLNVGRFANEVGVSPSQPYKTGYDAICSVYLIIGEEYATLADPTLRIYTGTADVEGEPNFRVGAQGYVNAQTQPTISSQGSEYVPVIALPYTMDWAEQQQTLAIQNTSGTDYYGLFGDVAPYILKNPGLYTQSTVGGLGKFLSAYPRTNDATGNWQTSSASPSLNISVYDYIYDRYSLSFINRNPVYQYYYSGGQYPYLQASSPLVAYFNFYDSAGNNIGHIAMPNYQTVPTDVFYGGNPRQTCGSQISVFSNSDNTELISLRVGPKDLDEMGIFSGLSQVPTSYTVQLFANMTIDGSCNYTGSPSVPLSELVTINITEDCTSYLYPRVRLAWLNTQGGRDYYNFTMFAEQSISSTQKEWYQSEVLWSNSTPVIKSDAGADQTQNWLHGGDKQYNKVVTNSWKITTNWLTQDEVSFLKDAAQSPQVWAYIGEVDFPYTCTIKETNYTVKTIKQVKVYTVTFTIETAVDRSMQIV